MTVVGPFLMRPMRLRTAVTIRRYGPCRSRYRTITSVIGSSACGHAERRPVKPERGISVSTRRGKKLASAEGQGHREDRYGAGLALDGDGAGVRFDECLYQAQAKAEAAFGPARVAAEQAGPDPWQFVGRNARSSVADPEDRAAIVATHLDADVPAGRRVLDRVVDQVGCHLLEPRA